MNALSKLIPDFNPLKDSVTVVSAGPYFYLRHVRDGKVIKAHRLRYIEDSGQFEKFDPKKMPLAERRSFTRAAYNNGLGVKPIDLATIFNISIAVINGDISMLDISLSNKTKEKKQTSKPKSPWSSLGI